MNKELMEWLASRSTSPFFVPDLELTLVSIPKSKYFSYLFYQKFNDKPSPLSKDDLKFGGIYCVKDGNIYCATDDLRFCFRRYEDLDSRTDKMLREQLTQKVREKVEAAIGNDRSNLTVTEITEPRLLRNLDYAERSSAGEAARAYFLEDKSLDSLAFSCEYKFEGWTKDNVLRYILDPDRFAEEQANVYMDTHQEDMLYTFLSNDLLRKEFTALTSDLTNPVHIVKKIMTAVKNSKAKTVNVTIMKNGRQFTFKTETVELSRDCQWHYSDWHIAAADRKLLQAELGRDVLYTPQEILRITYGRKILYEAWDAIWRPSNQFIEGEKASGGKE